MPHEPAHKAIVSAIIDAELEAAALARQAYEAGKSLSARLKILARNIAQLVVKKNVKVDQLTKVWVRAYVGLILLEYAQRINEVKAIADEHVTNQVKEGKKLGPAVRKVGAIRNADIKARENEKRGVNNAPS